MSSDDALTTNGAAAPSTNLASTPDPDSIDKSIPHATPDKSQDASLNATSKQSLKKERPETKQTPSEIEVGAGTKLSGAELKKKKAAEKAARRAEKVAVKGEQLHAEQTLQPASNNDSRPQSQQRRSSQAGSSSQKDNLLPPPQQQQQHHKRKPSNQPPEPGAVRLPFRPGQQPPQSQEKDKEKEKPRPSEKKVPMVSHLYPSARPATLANAPREIHPSVLTLGLHLRSLTLSGSTARTISLLLTLKRVIQSYTTPPNTALPRHLTQYLSHQITFLSSARPLGTAQGNAIRWLKKLISQIDVDLDESEAKKFLCNTIDSYIREKCTLAGEVISNQACARISESNSNPGSRETILVYAKSSLVERTLLQLARSSTNPLQIIVVDSRPLHEGRNLARSLLRAGAREGGSLSHVEVVYTLISGLAEIFEQNTVTKCLLGASAMLGNGSLYSRCGTAMVAMMAKRYSVPVVVLCETVKFTSKMSVDALGMNEIGDPSALIEDERDSVFTDVAAQEKAKVETEAGGNAKGQKGGGKLKSGGDKKDEDEDEEEGQMNNMLGGWKEQQNLFLLNLMYDVTPREYIDMVICELGTLPPGAVPVVNGVHGGDPTE